MGIGGSGISAVALISKKQGYSVTGCDLEEKTAYMREVKDAGIKVFKGHSGKHLKNVDLVVAVPSIFFTDKKSDELVKAEKENKVITWQEFLGTYLQKDKEIVAIAGTHGKSTITTLSALIFDKARKKESAVVGALVREWRKNYRFGKGKIFITEADEFYDNFLNYKPDTMLINNIEFDHPDFFKNEEEVFKSFRKFVKRLQGKKNLVLNRDSKGVKRLLKSINTNKLNIFGYSLGHPLFDTKHQITGTITKKTTSFTRFNTESDLWGKGDYELKIPGEYNVLNALGVIAIAKIYDISDKDINGVFKSFEGAGRRMELIGEKEGIKVYDDYAHHPTAIKATISALRQKYQSNRIWVVVEAHSYSRTKALLNEYRGAFDEADKVVIGPIFKARDTQNFGISEKSIVKASMAKNAVSFSNLDGLYEYLGKNLRKEDIVLVMGAGKSYQWAKEIYNLL